MGKSIVVLTSLVAILLALNTTVFRNKMVFLIVSGVCFVAISGTLVAKVLKYNK
ncbi:hypothetical protein [Clostridium oceanicum]|uniref:Uncharacterized protein n=1 Tax=Clostridium oceanicum TaxID=1543 RepID=A0ABP3USP8_9CLOT